MNDIITIIMIIIIKYYYYIIFITDRNNDDDELKADSSSDWGRIKMHLEFVKSLQVLKSCRSISRRGDQPVAMPTTATKQRMVETKRYITMVLFLKFLPCF